MIEEILGEKAKQQIEKIPLSNNEISTRIKEISENVLNQLIEDLKED